MLQLCTKHFHFPQTSDSQILSAMIILTHTNGQMNQICELYYCVVCRKGDCKIYDVWYLTSYKFLLFFYPEISTVKSTSVNFIGTLIINVSDDV